MKYINASVLSAVDTASANGVQIDASQLLAASFQAVFGDATAAGTLKIQMSNDISVTNYTANTNFTVTNWTDIANATATIASGASAVISLPQGTYPPSRWLRAVYSSTATGIQTIAPIADTGVKQVQSITAVADVADSLNSTYLLLSSINTSTKAQKNFYMWFDTGTGVDPAVASRTGIHVVISTGDSAEAVAIATRSALNALTGDFVATGVNAIVTVTNVAQGPVTAAVDSVPAPTGFSFGAATAGVASNLNNTYFLLNSANNTPLYYVWMNVGAIGTDPLISGRTALPITLSPGASAASVGTALAAAIDGLAAFIAAGTTTVTVTNAASGPFVPMSDGGTAATHFTFAVTAGGTSTINVNLFGIAV